MKYLIEIESEIKLKDENKIDIMYLIGKYIEKLNKKNKWKKAKLRF